MQASLIWSVADAGKRRPIDPLRYGNLQVIPYVRGRLVFAQVVAQFLERQAVDQVVVDLPQFLEGVELLELAHRFFPCVFAVLVRRRDRRPLFLPLAPNDAAYLATYVAGRRPIPYGCVDDPHRPFYPEGALFAPSLPLPDDLCALSVGLERHFTPLWARLDSLWTRATPLERTYTDIRAATVAANLRGAMANGHRVLFVCEYRLWWAVRRLLEQPSTDPSSRVAVPDPEQIGILVADDPEQAWVRGDLDDFPAVTCRFTQAVQAGQAQPFDKLATLDGLLTEAVRRAAATPTGGVSPRTALAFRQYLWGLVAGARRISPHPTRHLLEAAHGCFGKSFARDLAALLLEYPDTARRALGRRGVFFRIVAGRRPMRRLSAALPDTLAADAYYTEEGLEGSETESRERWAAAARRGLSREERREIGGSIGGITWAWKADYLLYADASARVRGAVSRAASQTRTRQSWGSLGDGIDWKATTAARIRGERAVYVKRSCRSRSEIPLDEYTPVVFLFSPDLEDCTMRLTHDANLTQRRINLGLPPCPSAQHLSPDLVFTVLRMINEREDRIEGYVQKESSRAMVLLYSKGYMGLERYAAMTRRPIRFQCREHPELDAELRAFSTTEERLVAWAIKYAERAVLVIAYAGWGLSQSLVTFAQARGVRVISQYLSALPTAMVQRLQTSYYLSTPLKKHPRLEQIVRRAVE